MVVRTTSLMCLAGVVMISGLACGGNQPIKTALHIPHEAVLATTDRGTDVFVASRKGPLGIAEKCVGFVDLMEETVEACGTNAKAEREGINVMNIVDGMASTVVVLVPRHTLAVLFTNSNGVTEDIPVRKMIAILQGVPIASFSYVLPSGRVHTTTIHWPRPTGHPAELS
jgi:hypothetical protein